MPSPEQLPSNNRVQNITNGFPFFTAGGVPFPSPEVTNAGFFALFGTIFPLLLIIGLLYPLANNVSQLVREKESKIREGMKMMSLRSEALWLSWWLHFLELYFPLAIILSLCASSLFQYSEGFLTFLFFFFFLVSSTAFGILVSAFFTNSRTAVIVNFLLFIGGYFIVVGIETGGAGSQPSRTSRLGACLHPAAAFSYATYAFQEYEDTQIGVTNLTAGSSSKYNFTFNGALPFFLLFPLLLSFLTPLLLVFNL